jgi:hypothetical protein
LVVAAAATPEAPENRKPTSPTHGCGESPFAAEHLGDLLPDPQWAVRKRLVVDVASVN